MARAKRGMDGRIYYNEGSYNSPSWTEITNVKNCAMGKSKTKADVSRRGRDFKTYRGAQKDLTVTFNMNNDGGADVATVNGWFMDDTVIDILYLDGPLETSGSKGFRMDVEAFDFSDTQNLDEGQDISVELAPADSDHEPIEYEVA